MKDLKRFYQQRAWLFFMENPVLVRLMIKKNDQELVDNLQDSSKFFMISLILYGFARSLKEKRSCSIA